MAFVILKRRATPIKRHNRKAIWTCLIFAFLTCGLSLSLGGFTTQNSQLFATQDLKSYEEQETTSPTPIGVHQSAVGDYTFLPVGGNKPLYFIPVILTNTQSTATQANYQVQITINSNANASLFAANLSNVNWQDGKGTILKSWLESGASNTSSSSKYWVNLAQHTIDGNNGQLTIYEMIYAPTVNAMNNYATGAYPCYSGYTTGTYGRYDSGFAVFSLYDNFVGSTLNTTFWNTGGFGTITVNNRLRISSGSNAYIYSKTSFLPTNTTFEANWSVVYVTTTGRLNFGFNGRGATPANSLYWRSTSSSVTATTRNSASGANIDSFSSGLSGYQIFGVWSNTTGYNAFASRAGLNASTTSAVDTASAAIYIENNGGSNTNQNLDMGWVRVRITPPNSVTPSINVGTVTDLKPSVSISALYAIIDQGNSSSISYTLLNGGFPDYSFQWFAKSPIASSYSAIGAPYGQLVTYPFTTTTSTDTGVWNFILQVTDNNGTASNSTPSAITVNSQLQAPAISPSSCTTDVGVSVSFANISAVSTGTAPYSAKWFNSSSIGGTYSEISGATLFTYNFLPWRSSNQYTQYFRLNVTDATGATAVSNIITVVVNPELSAPLVQASYQTIDIGNSSVVSNATIIGIGTSPYSYQWLMSTTGPTGTYTSVSGATSLSYTFTPSVAGTYYFKLQVTDSASTPVTVTSSNYAMVTVNNVPTLSSPPVTVSHATIDQGNSSTLALNTVSYGTTPFGYQWYCQRPGQGNYFALSGATLSYYNFVTSTLNTTGTYYFYVNVTDATGVSVTNFGNPVTVLLNSLLLSPTISSNATLDRGSVWVISSTTITTGTSGYTYTWLYSTNPDPTILYAYGSFGAPNSPTLTVDTMAWPFSTTIFYYIMLNVTDSAGVPQLVSSNILNVTINTQLVAPNVAITSPVTIDQGQSISVGNSTIITTGTPGYTPVWLGRLGTGSWSVISTGSWSITYIPSSAGAWHFVLNVTDSASVPVTVQSNVIDVTVNPPLVAPSVIATPNPVIRGQNITLTNTTLPTYGTLPYTFQWYQMAPGATSFSLISGATNYTYSMNTTGMAIGTTWYFQLNVTDAVGQSVTAVTVAVTIDDVPQYSSMPSNLPYVYGSTGNSLTWVPTDALSTSRLYTIAVNGYTNTTGLWSSGMPITIAVSGLAVGSYTWSCNVTDGFGGYNFSSVLVTVTDDLPILTLPSNMTYTYGQTNKIVSWSVSDGAYISSLSNFTVLVYNFTSGSYTITTIGNWTALSGNNTIYLNVTGWWPGSYNCSIVVNDGYLIGWSTNWVNVTVLNDVPHVLTDTPHINMLTGAYVELNFTITDGAFNETYYIIYKSIYETTNYEVNQTGTWISGNRIFVDITDLGEGNYNFTIIGWDGIIGGNFSLEVDVYVSSSPPPTITAVTTMTVVISSPLVVVCMNATAGNNITWTITDSVKTSPAPFTVYQDNVSICTGNWFSNGSVVISVDGLDVGIYNFTLVADNGYGQLTQLECNVIVNDAPVTTSAGDIIFIWQTTGNTISWTVTKTLNNTVYFDTSFTLILNGQYFNSSTWVNNTPIVVNLDTLTWGSYSYTIDFSDGLGGTCSDYGTIIVDEQPSLNNPANLTYTFGTTGQSISWVVSYGMTAPFPSYNILINGSLSQYAGAWANGGTIPSPAINLDSLNLAVGTTTFICIVSDGYGGQDTSTVTVTVLDDIPLINDPGTLTYSFNTTGNAITWVVTHKATLSGSFIVYVNGTTTQWATGTWSNGVPILVNVDTLSMGTSTFFINATDGLGGFCTSQVQVIVTDDVPQVSMISVTYTYGQTGNNLIWIVYDNYTSSSRSYTIAQNGFVLTFGEWTPYTINQLSVDGLYVGDYNYSITVDDGLGKGSMNWVYITVLDDIPVINQAAAVIYYIGATGNIINWTVSDGAYTTTSYSVFINSTTRYQVGGWESGSAIIVNVDGLNVGSYNFSMIVYDGLGQSNLTYVLVTVNPLIPGIVTPNTPATQTHQQRDNAEFSFTLTDGNSGLPYLPNQTIISVVFTSPNAFSTNFLTWTNGTSDGNFTLTVTTANILAGPSGTTYTLLVTFLRANYTDVQAVVTLTILSYQPQIDVAMGVIKVYEGLHANVSVNVTDPMFHVVFDQINIQWFVYGMDINGNITQVSATGNYFVTFPTIGLPTETNYIILMTVSVSIGTETYTYALPLIANVFVINYQPAVTVPTNVQIVEEGGTVTIPISVIDTHLNSNFTAIKIDWIVYDASNILQITGTITQVNTGGNYFISFSVANLAPDAIYHVVIAVNVTANNVEYKYDATILSVNINVQYTTILGIPRPYFWIMMVAVIGLVGTLVIYRSVKYARIPQFIRDIQRARTTIRKGKSAGRENITETRGESISKSLEARYAALGISPVEKYAPKSSADAGKAGGERNPEKEVA